MKNASSLRRILAFLIDVLIIAIFFSMLIITLIIFEFFNFSLIQDIITPRVTLEFKLINRYHGFVDLLGFLITLGYFTILEGTGKGKTVGKKFLGIRVIKKKKRNAGLGRSLIRNLARLIWDLPVIGFLLFLIDLILIIAKKRRIGDYIAGTRVIKG